MPRLLRRGASLSNSKKKKKRIKTEQRYAVGKKWELLVSLFWFIIPPTAE